MAKKLDLFTRRKQRTRSKLRKRSGERMRLTVFRSNLHIYAQVVDDRQGRTLAAASSLEKGLRAKLRTGGSVETAGAVCALIAEHAAAAGIKDVVFDRGGVRYHGRVKALAEAAREGGLSF